MFGSPELVLMYSSRTNVLSFKKISNLKLKEFLILLKSKYCGSTLKLPFKKNFRNKSSSVVINFDSVGSGVIHKPVVCASAFLIILIKVEHCALANH